MVTENNAKHFQDTGPPAHSITQLAASLPSAAQNKKCSFKYFPREHAQLSSVQVQVHGARAVIGGQLVT